MFKVNLLHFCFFKREYSTFLQIFPRLLGMPTFLVAWKPILSLLVQLWQKNNAYVTFPVRLFTHAHFQLCSSHIAHYTGTAIPKSIRAQWQNTSRHDATLKNFATQHCNTSSLGPLVSQKWEEMKNEPRAMCSTRALTYSSVHFKTRKRDFLLVKQHCHTSEHYLYKLRAEHTKKKHPNDKKAQIPIFCILPWNIYYFRAILLYCKYCD